MQFKGFKLNVMVNNCVLKEYKLPASELGFSVALKSHVFNKKKNQKEISPLATFVAVPEPGTSYKIRYSSKVADCNRPLKVKIYVDGQNDGGYTNLVNDLPFIKEGFCNKDCDKIYELVFDKAEWTDLKNPNANQTEYGGLGVISVYFYEAQFVMRKKSKSSLKKVHDLKRIKVSETKNNFDITLTTKFDKGEDFVKPEPGDTILSRTCKEPIAVIHLNYRPISWFIAKGISIKQIKQNPDGNNEEDLDVEIKIEKDVPEKGLQGATQVMKRKFGEMS